MALISNAADFLAQPPGVVTSKWPDGERVVRALAHGTMSVEIYSLVSADLQTPPEQDELYFVNSGHATVLIRSELYECHVGTVALIPGGADHKVCKFSADFSK